MRKLTNLGDEFPFSITCKCGRKSCHYDFTDSNNIVIHCRSCGRTKIVWRGDVPV
jgi:hypothetical protein